MKIYQEELENEERNLAELKLRMSSFNQSSSKLQTSKKEDTNLKGSVKPFESSNDKQKDLKKSSRKRSQTRSKNIKRDMKKEKRSRKQSVNHRKNESIETKVKMKESLTSGNLEDEPQLSIHEDLGSIDLAQESNMSDQRRKEKAMMVAKDAQKVSESSRKTVGFQVRQPYWKTKRRNRTKDSKARSKSPQDALDSLFGIY